MRRKPGTIRGPKRGAKRLINRLVYVKWVDSYGCSSRWEPVAGATPSLLTCESVGWLIHADSRTVCVVPHLTGEGRAGIERQGCGDMTIPAACVLKLAPMHVGASRF
jgi:hypothetical protein